MRSPSQGHLTWPILTRDRIDMSALVHRLTNNSTALRWISVGNCWHLDTWFYNSANQPWLVVRTGNGTGALYGLAAYLLERDAFGLWERTQCVPLESLEHIGGAPVLITDPQARQLFGDISQADIAFKCTAQPLGELWPRATHKRRSIRHHMLAPVYVSNPCDQFRNLYGSTGRAERDLQLARAAR